MLKLLYFAWVRERTGQGSEDVARPDGVATVADLMEWQAGRGAGYAEAFADPARLRVAVNQEHVGADHPVADGDEIAFFPPVTGG
jgi:molybdopterin synthase sulfur carrier subunit